MGWTGGNDFNFLDDELAPGRGLLAVLPEGLQVTPDRLSVAGESLRFGLPLRDAPRLGWDLHPVAAFFDTMQNHGILAHRPGPLRDRTERIVPPKAPWQFRRGGRTGPGLVSRGLTVSTSVGFTITMSKRHSLPRPRRIDGIRTTLEERESPPQ